MLSLISVPVSAAFSLVWWTPFTLPVSQVGHTPLILISLQSLPRWLPRKSLQGSDPPHNFWAGPSTPLHAGKPVTCSPPAQIQCSTSRSFTKTSPNESKAITPPFLCTPCFSLPGVSKLPRSQTCRCLWPLGGSRHAPARPVATGNPGSPPPFLLGMRVLPRTRHRSPDPRPPAPCQVARRREQLARGPREPSALGRGAARRGRGRAEPGGAEQRGPGCGPASSAASCRRACLPACRSPFRECGVPEAGRGEAAGPARGAPGPQPASPAEPGDRGSSAPLRGGRGWRGRSAPLPSAMAAAGPAEQRPAGRRAGAAGRIVGGPRRLCRAWGGALPRRGPGPVALPAAGGSSARRFTAVLRTGG